MRNPRVRPLLIAAIIAFACLIALPPLIDINAQKPAAADQPKLVVLVVFDQMRGDYLVKWQKLFDKDGFGRLQRDGAWFQNCHYPYAFTLTAPGHTSIATGCAPYKHGIIANDWYDPSARTEVGAVKADRYFPVPPPPAGQKKEYGAAPLLRLQPTFSDGLDKMGKGADKAKVVSLSIKDRAAILMAAMRATAVYWFNTLRGLFETSTFYRDEPHPWVAAFNKQRPADGYFNKDWTRFKPDLDYEKFSGPDNLAFEGTGYKQGRTFPHPMTGGLTTPGEKYYEAFTLSPAASDVLLELAKQAIDAEKLGQRDACDVLCLSFSSNDLVGHCWGPDSQEVLDITLRSDIIIKELLNYLDAKVGAGKYVMVLTADHGVCPVPELATSQGKDAGRVPPNLFTNRAAEMLQQKFAPKQKLLPWIEKSSSGWIYFNHATLKEAGVSATQAEDAVVNWLPQQPGIQAAYGRSRLERGSFGDDKIGQSVRCLISASAAATWRSF